MTEARPHPDIREHGSVVGLARDTVPWRLWERSKQAFWDPAEIDLSADRADWDALDPDEQRFLFRLCGAFMIGEEEVTIDILPLLRVISGEERLAETMYLTMFAMEEAKHVDFFRRWFDAVGLDDTKTRALAGHRGITTVELPRVMARLETDASPKAVLDAGLTYNQFIEGVAALSGYHLFSRIFAEHDVLPGLQRGFELIQRDERRHIAYGTFLCRRLLAAHPELWSFVEPRMEELWGIYAELSREGGLYAGSEPPYPFGLDPGELLTYGEKQISRRLEVMEFARRMRVEEVERGRAEERLEEELGRD